MSTPSIRGESPRHYSSLRLVAQKAGVKIRLKETLNDWWVPVGNDVNLRRVQGHVLIGDEVAHTGRDYHGKPGACAQILGTTIEAYAQDGTPTPATWADLYSSLEAADPKAIAEARKTTFAERNYWGRWEREMGPWDSHEFTRPGWMRPDPDTFEKVAWASTPDRWAPMPGAPDSIASLERDGRREIQVLFRQPMTLNYKSWLRIVEPPDEQGPVGGRDPRYPQRWETTTVKGRTVRWAALQPSVGTWFFAWDEVGRSFELHLRAAKGLDQARATAILGSILV